MKVTFPKGFFMRVIVIFCLAYIVYLTERSLALNASVGSAVDGIYVAAVAFFGTELVMTMAKTITELVRKEKKKQEEEENDDRN